MWIKALAAGALAVAAVAIGLAFAGSAVASSGKEPVCARPGTPGNGTGVGVHAVAKAPKAPPRCKQGPGAPAPGHGK
jgi:hypothetical protein